MKEIQEAFVGALSTVAEFPPLSSTAENAVTAAMVQALAGRPNNGVENAKNVADAVKEKLELKFNTTLEEEVILTRWSWGPDGRTITGAKEGENAIITYLVANLDKDQIVLRTRKS